MRKLRNTILVALAALSLSHACFAEKLVDPDKVAPEYREAAVRRRAEQIKLLECNHKADQATVSRRDRTEFVEHCLEDK